MARRAGAAVTRRGLLAAAGAVTLAVASEGAAQERKKAGGEEPKKQVERTFEGESKEGKFQDALDRAVAELGKALGDGGVSDAQAAWKIAAVTGVSGGITGARSVKVTITATRTPDWPKK